MKMTARQIERLAKQGEVLHTECKDASGIFSVNKAVAVEGGTSDARNSHIFNIFALVDIGERSGMGLADLYGHWKKHGLPEPVISEEYDPDRVKVTVYTDSDQGPANRPKSAPKTAQSAPRVPQGDPRPDQDPVKTRPIAWSDLPSSCRQVYEALRQDAFLTYRGMVSELGLNKDTINTAIASKDVLGRESGGDVTQNVTQSVTQNVTQSVTQNTVRKLTKTQLNILGLIRGDGSISQAKMAEELGISRRTVLRNIAAMPDIVRRVGPDKGGHWELSEANNEGVHP